ncbi:UNKNOWN [Stylonychia lemnae]|uniref:Uncharacterized protein n=1 Tax=Stylonychia lemnae TaxID=5949 RepID=A0A078ATC3_STYLE|nr:UNKNOWN [Stylonychia lemnae]|eukprot:CDW84427.1 UNKNOWN [Stylonychia lemnae]
MLLTESKKDKVKVSRLSKQDISLNLPNAVPSNQQKYLLHNSNVRKQLNFKSEQVSPTNSFKARDPLLTNYKQNNNRNTYFNMRSPSGGNPYEDSAKKPARNNPVNVLNMSTDNLIRPEYQKFYDINQRSGNIDIDDSKSKILNNKIFRNGNQSTSLAAQKRSLDGLNPNFNPLLPDSKHFTSTTHYSSLIQTNPHQTLKAGQSIGFNQERQSSKLPSIFENYLKFNPIASPMMTKGERNKNTIALLDQSSVLELSSEQKAKLFMPIEDSALLEAKRKFINTTLRKQITAKTSLGLALNLTARSGIENSVINESSEDPLGSTGVNFRKKKINPNNALLDGMSKTQSIIYKSLEDKKQGLGDKAAQRWKLLQNLDFLDDEEDAINFNMQIPKFDPVCFCNIGPNKGKPCEAHDSIDTMIDLLNIQFEQVQKLNVNVREEIDYLDNSVQKIVFLRGHTFYEQVMNVINEKNSEIQELKTELSRLMILKKDNEILKMRIDQMEDDQDYMKEKVSHTKQQKSLLDKLETIVKELRIQLSSKENENVDLYEQLQSQSRETKNYLKQLQEERAKNQDMQDRIDMMELQVKRLNKENNNLKLFIEGQVNEIETKDVNLIEKGKKLLEANFKMNNTNVMSENLSLLEHDVEGLSMIRYLAIAAVDVSKNRDVVAVEQQRLFDQQLQLQQQLQQELQE